MVLSAACFSDEFFFYPTSVQKRKFTTNEFIEINEGNNEKFRFLNIFLNKLLDTFLNEILGKKYCISSMRHNEEVDDLDNNFNHTKYYKL